MDKIVAVNIAAWLACAWFVVGLANSLFKLRHNAMGEAPKPTNPELSIVQNNLTGRVETLEENVDAVRAQTAREREADRISATARSAGIYKKIDEVSDRLTEKMENLERRVIEKQEKITLLLIRGSRHHPGSDSETPFT